MTTVPANEKPEPTTLVLQVSVVEDTNYGDHGERITKAHVYVPGETVEDLVRRVLPDLTRQWSRFSPSDTVELRVAIGADGEPTGQVTNQTTDPWATL